MNHIKREKIATILLNIATSVNTYIGQKDCLLKAIEYYQKGKADFGDYLILAESEENSAFKLATFDKKLIKANKNCHNPNTWIKH